MMLLQQQQQQKQQQQQQQQPQEITTFNYELSAQQGPCPAVELSSGT